MTRLRVETATFPNTGKVYAELYFPEDELVPIAITGPIYPNREEAVKQACVMFECWKSIMAAGNCKD